MTFKKGDMVRRVRNGNEHCPIGGVVEVKSLENGCFWYEGRSGQAVWGMPENFELVSPPLVTVETRTVHSINSGLHGRLRVAQHPARTDLIHVAITSLITNRIVLASVNADELDALAEQFKALAGALRNAAE
jgi:uncharacterized protein YejL (UPF0352 family)